MSNPQGTDMTPADFVEKVAALRMPSVFNPYADTCSVYDRPDAPLRRQANLEQFLRAAMEAPDLSLWVGRDLGYRGGRRTGIALTDEVHLDRLCAVYSGKIKLSRATHGPPVSERTASVFWDMIGRLKGSVFTWNIFPLHPHLAGNALSNRCHTRSERKQTSEILDDLLLMLRPRQLIAIGNDAEAGLQELGLGCLKVRHPSYGGISDFRAGVASSHDLHEPIDFTSQPNLI